MTNSKSITNRLVLILLGMLSCVSSDTVVADREVSPVVFEEHVRPVLLAKCGNCHSDEVREANLDFRSMAALMRGGDSGPALVKGRADQSVLLERIDAGEMPPSDQPALTSSEIELIRAWIDAGAVANESDVNSDEWSRRLVEGEQYWAFQPLQRRQQSGTSDRSELSPKNKVRVPDHTSLADSLQAWYRADRLKLRHGEAVKEWKDESGKGRHLRPTWARMDAQVGAPPRFVNPSTVGGMPAVRFHEIAGLGSTAEIPVDVHGDAGWTMIAAVNVRPPSQSTATSVIVGFGDPMPASDPGKPRASLLEIHRETAQLRHAGGFGHDAALPARGMWAIYDRPQVITLVKQSGAMSATTTLVLNGSPVAANQITGSSLLPDIRHRDDFSIFMGHAANELGALRGDIAEVAIYNRSLGCAERKAIEQGMMRKYGIDIPHLPDAAEISDRHRQGMTPSFGSTLHPIDEFIDTKLDEHELSSAPLADRRTLIRRAYFDLLGLPPTPEQITAFVNDEAPDAWEQLLERLLHSKHYGERWGRHWLDVARYADTGGYETDIYYHNAWRYRDYVVKSFNDDKPYDQFVQEQIAADELWPNNLDLDGSYVMDPEKLRHFEALTGTGFYAFGPQIHESNMDAKKRSYEQLSDWVDTTTAAFLGLTFGCARCHDHKFDPISQRDYYSLQAVFAGSRTREAFIQPDMGLADWGQHYPKIIAVAEARQAYLRYEQQTSVDERTDAEKEKLQELKNQLADRLLAVPLNDAQKEPYVTIYQRPTVTVLGHYRGELAPQVWLLSRGDLKHPKKKMVPRLPALLAAQMETDPVLPLGPSGSRKELALWLTRPDHPLTSRVMVNRIWQWHFGRGIVATPNDFGKMGVPPTHPQLLDWLATEFVDQGWSIKAMHRLIMTSQAYRRDSSFATDRHRQVDPENLLYWRMNRRRLEGEAIWDAVHAVAGTINLELGGRPVMPPLLAEELTNKSNWVESLDPSQHTRRGLYIIVRRNFNFPLFELFDAPVNAVSCSGRDVSTVAPQALWLLNNHLGFNQAKHFADRLVRDRGTESEDQVRWAWQLALGREPTETEVTEAVQLIDQLQAVEADAVLLEDAPEELAKLPPAKAAALTKFSLTLLNLNEFVYVD